MTQLPYITADDVVSEVALTFRVTMADIHGPRRFAHLVDARHAAQWIAYREMGLGGPETGRKIGKRDHTSVLHAVSRIDALLNAGDGQMVSRINGAVSRLRRLSAARGEAQGSRPVPVLTFHSRYMRPRMERAA